MAKGKDTILGVDVDLSLFELTDEFYSYYKYHNEDCLLAYDEVMSIKGTDIKTSRKSLSRFDAFRRIEAARLGSRPFLGGKGISVTKPNVSLGYTNYIFSYVRLPYKSVLSEEQIVRIKVDKNLFDQNKLSDTEKQTLDAVKQQNPLVISNQEIGDNIGDAFNELLNKSTHVQKCEDFFPARLVQDALVAAVHSDVDNSTEPVNALDLVTEPMANWDAEEWRSFFVIKRMPVSKIAEKIKNPGKFWDEEALRWALESSISNRGLINGGHSSFSPTSDSDAQRVCRENFLVKSFYAEKGLRQTNINSYYGSLVVVEAYYVNKDNKVHKVIFFPSCDFHHIPKEDREKMNGMSDSEKEKLGFKGANVLFSRETTFKDLKSALTIIPADRSEPSLERQRFFGHETFPIIETIMRIDSSILNAVMLMGVGFYKDLQQGNDAQALEDLEINLGGEAVNLGDREWTTTPFTTDLQSMITVKNILFQYLGAKAFLGGLDGAEASSSGQQAKFASQRLVRDRSVHKHNIEDFSKGLKEYYLKIFRKTLDISNDEALRSGNTLIDKIFYNKIVGVFGHPKEILEVNKKDVLEDTGLPYWMDLDVIRSGAAHFGPAEMVLYSEIKNSFGDGLDQQQLAALNRAAIKSLLGTQDAMDILGDPNDKIFTEQDQLYRAEMENGIILGSVDAGSLRFESIRTTPKDDDVAHLTQIHMPKVQELMDTLDQGEVTPESLAEATIEQLETRTNVVMQIAALANHISLHQDRLAVFGDKRSDINELREQVNSVLQSAEAMFNRIQLNLRALQTKRNEREIALRGMSPENEAARMEIEKELQELQVQREIEGGKLALANKIADQRQQQHIDKQVSKARDRNLKKDIAEKTFQEKALEKENSKEFVNGTR